MNFIEIKTKRRCEWVDVTAGVQQAIEQAGWREGLCFLFVPHTTAAVTLNEGADPAVQKDILQHLDRLVPEQGDYRHAEGNSDAHIKASMIGATAVVSVERGHLALGTWQSIFFCEFDGPRLRRLGLRFMAEAEGA